MGEIKEIKDDLVRLIRLALAEQTDDVCAACRKKENENLKDEDDEN